MSIKSIMADEKLTPKERRLSIQALMDGRRRSSVNARKSASTGMAAAAAMAALELNGALSEEEEVDDTDGPCNRKQSGVITDSAESTFVSSGMSVDSSNTTMMLTGCKSEGTPDTAFILYQQSVAVLAASAYYEGQNSLKTMQLSKQLENQRPRCDHYERNCTIIAACCGMAFGCRLCHDECEVLPPPIFDMQKELEEKHAEHQGRSTSSNVRV